MPESKYTSHRCPDYTETCKYCDNNIAENWGKPCKGFFYNDKNYATMKTNCGSSPESITRLRNQIMSVFDDYVNGLKEEEPEKKELKKEDFVSPKQVYDIGSWLNSTTYSGYSDKEHDDCKEDCEKLNLHLCLLRIARELNGDWKVDMGNERWYITFLEKDLIPFIESDGYFDVTKVYFKSREDCQLALDYITKNFDLDKIKG